MTKIVRFEDYRLLAELARREGLTYSALRERLKEQGLSLEEAVERARNTLIVDIAQRAERQQNTIDATYGRLEDVTQRADKQEVCIDDLYARVEALEREPKPRREKRFRVGLIANAAAVLITLGGLVYSTMNQQTPASQPSPRLTAAAEKYERALEEARAYDTSMNSAEFGRKDNYTQGQTQYWALIAKQQARRASEELTLASLADWNERFGFQ